jgi:formylglycine-generating enzyme required for sulfatase activity
VTGHPPPPHWIGGRAPRHEGDHPVACVTLDDARRYAAWRGVRLPTALEWESAARGPSSHRFPWGDTWEPARCHGPEGGARATAPVGRLLEGASHEGCLDLVGNVWEWTEPDARAPAPLGSAWVLGGSFRHSGCQGGRIARTSIAVDKVYAYLGFRCAGAP